jgi:hypothetical protein
VADAARVDEIEVTQVRVHVERKPVKRHPAAHGHADRGDLLISRPDARVGRLAIRADLERARDSISASLDVAEGSDAGVATTGKNVQQDDGVADDLPRAVVRSRPRRRSTGTTSMPRRAELGRPGAEILVVPRPAHGEHRLVLERIEDVGASPRAHRDPRGWNARAAR